MHEVWSGLFWKDAEKKTVKHGYFARREQKTGWRVQPAENEYPAIREKEQTL